MFAPEIADSCCTCAGRGIVTAGAQRDPDTGTWDYHELVCSTCEGSGKLVPATSTESN